MDKSLLKTMQGADIKHIKQLNSYISSQDSFDKFKNSLKQFEDRWEHIINYLMKNIFIMEFWDRDDFSSSTERGYGFDDGRKHVYRYSYKAKDEDEKYYVQFDSYKNKPRYNYERNMTGVTYVKNNISVLSIRRLMIIIDDITSILSFFMKRKSTPIERKKEFQEILDNISYDVQTQHKTDTLPMELEAMTVVQLKELARKNKISGFAKLKKQELIDKLCTIL